MGGAIQMWRNWVRWNVALLLWAVTPETTARDSHATVIRLLKLDTSIIKFFLSSFFGVFKRLCHSGDTIVWRGAQIKFTWVTQSSISLVISWMEGKERKKKLKIDRFIWKNFVTILWNIFYTKSLVYNLVLSYLCANSCKGESVLKKNALLVLFKKQQEIVDYRVWRKLERFQEMLYISRVASKEHWATRIHTESGVEFLVFERKLLMS